MPPSPSPPPRPRRRQRPRPLLRRPRRPPHLHCIHSSICSNLSNAGGASSGRWGIVPAGGVIAGCRASEWFRMVQLLSKTSCSTGLHVRLSAVGAKGRLLLEDLTALAALAILSGGSSCGGVRRVLCCAPRFSFARIWIGWRRRLRLGSRRLRMEELLGDIRWYLVTLFTAAAHFVLVGCSDLYTPVTFRNAETQACSIAHRAFGDIHGLAVNVFAERDS